MYVCMYLYISSVYLCIYVCIYVSVYVSVIYISMYLCICLCIYVSVYLCICLSVYPSICSVILLFCSRNEPKALGLSFNSQLYLFHLPGCKCHNLLWPPFCGLVLVTVTKQHLLPNLCLFLLRGGRRQQSLTLDLTLPGLEAGLVAVGNSGLLRVALPLCPRDPLLAEAGTTALFKALK